MNGDRVRNYRDLEVWRRAKALAVEIYRLTEGLPGRERYNLIDQIRRSAVSIPANIAEGHIRRSDRVFARHLDIALGSAAELATELEIAMEVGYLSQEAYNTLKAELQEIMRMLFVYATTVSGKRQRLPAPR